MKKSVSAFSLVVMSISLLWLIGNWAFNRLEGHHISEKAIPDTTLMKPDTSVPVHISTAIDSVIASPIVSSSIDTSITFDIEDVSEEGSEVVARYHDFKLVKAEWNIYGETGKDIINYEFQSDGTINCVEKEYRYRTTLTDVKSSNDVKLKNTLQYTIDTSGSLLTRVNDPDFYNAFKVFKANVPLQLIRN